MARFVKDAQTRALTPAFRQACKEALSAVGKKEHFGALDPEERVLPYLSEDDIEEIKDNLKVFGIKDGAKLGRAIYMSEKTGQRLYADLTTFTYQKYTALLDYCKQDMDTTTDKRLSRKKWRAYQDLRDFLVDYVPDLYEASVNELACRCLVDGFLLLADEQLSEGEMLTENCETLLRVLYSLLTERHGNWEHVVSDIEDCSEDEAEDIAEYKNLLIKYADLLYLLDALLYENEFKAYFRLRDYIEDKKLSRKIDYSEGIFEEYISPYKD